MTQRGKLGCARIAVAERGRYNRQVGSFAAGEIVRTIFGTGTVRANRGRSHVVVDIAGRSFVVPVARVSPVVPPTRRSVGPPQQETAESSDRHAPGMSIEVDLHGLTVNESLERVERALNDAALGNVATVRLVHGRGTGRVRLAVQRLLEQIPSVRHFQLDPRNAGVTVVTL
ncbi:MAG: Smr/MutS family protein [Vicinamibacterales bacterium]